ncbi:putative vacuolar conductance protein [Scheffersomyces amazonensis]|uniref:putative vacuolar conductance protein n=1 Tax=Scheffersomyces amazonensis TaxID=1078765 RepID=UPI00315CD4AF
MSEDQAQAELDLEQSAPLLANQQDSESGIFDTFCPNSRQTLRICLHLKTLIDKVIPIVFDSSEISSSNSPILNSRVLELVYEAAGGKGNGKPHTSSYKYRAALVFCLLRVCGWYWQQAEFELSDNKLYLLRAETAQILAAKIIDSTSNDEYLFLGLLCHRYVINLNNIDATPVSALELAVDMHSTIVIGSAGYQRCIKWLWRGWIVQSSTDPHAYVMYKGVSSNSLRVHFDPERVKTPLYQNILEILISIIYLILFTIILNGHQMTTDALDVFEIIFFLITLGSVLDEIVKFYHVGYYYLGFWNAFNDVMYTIIFAAIGFRLASVNTSKGSLKEKYDEIGYRILSCAAPFMWSRLLLFLDAQQFVGAMIVVIKTMMKESIYFFVLLLVVIVGFLQGFLGLDASDGKNEATFRILISLVKAIIGESSFEDVSELVPPYASILYYIYSFVLTVILMNILIALYSTAYAAIVENATDEYFALVAQKTLRYIRAPDVNLYVAPFNLIEFLITPIGWFIPKSTFKSFNYYILLIIYSPLLVYITSDELANANRIQYNRYKGVADDANEYDTEWDLTDGFEGDYFEAGGFESIQERNQEVNQELRIQREGEEQDPEFRIDFKKFEADIDSAVKSVNEANKLGIKWEFYELYDKIDKLTTLVEAVVKENEELKKKVAEK